MSIQERVLEDIEAEGYSDARGGFKAWNPYYGDECLAYVRGYVRGKAAGVRK